MAQQTPGAKLEWLADLSMAQTRAKTEGKMILLFFHGSDWCPTCAELQKQVFETSEFSRFAQHSLVLVDVDFPEKQPQNDSLRHANLALRNRFNIGEEVDGAFPTIALLNEKGGVVFEETGYWGGGVAEVIPKLQRHTEAGARATDSAPFKNLTIDQFAEMAGEKGNIILDVRTPREFSAGHLAGAVNLDVNSPDFDSKAAALDKSRVYLVHCASGVRSVKACKKLGQLDFPRLYNLPGGYKAWVQAGKPVEK